MGRLGSTTPTIANCCGFLVAVLLLSVVGPAPPAQADFTKERKFSTDQHDDWEPHIAADAAGHFSGSWYTRGL